MNADWRALSRAAGFRPERHQIEVRFGDQRGQRVFVEEPNDGAIRIWSVVAKPADVRRLDQPLVEAWRRNRLSEFVGFTLDTRGRMIGEVWVPLDGLEVGEWRFHVWNLARACDRFEYLITGEDEA